MARPGVEPVPRPKRERIHDDGEEGSRRECADEKRDRRIFDHLHHIVGRDFGVVAGEDEAADPVLYVNEKRECERIRNPSRCDGGGHIDPRDVGDEAGGQHLKWRWHEGEKCSHGEPCCEALSRGVPEFLREQAIAKPAVKPRAPEILHAREMPQILTKAATPPEDGFHLLRCESFIRLAKSGRTRIY